MKIKIILGSSLLFLFFINSLCGEEQWSTRQINVMEGFKSPACVVIDAVEGSVYISNIYTEKKGYWTDDELGFISKIDKEGKLILKWAEPTLACALNAPKGLALLNGYLFINDNHRLLRCPLNNPKMLTEVKLNIKSVKLNDIITDGDSLWISDTEAERIFGLFKDGPIQVIDTPYIPPAITGIARYKQKMYGVSWKEHDLYELYPDGKKEATAFALGSHFINLTSLEILDSNNFLVADFWGNKICLVTLDKKTVTTLIRMETPTDLAWDQAKGLLYITQLFKDKVIIFELNRKML